MIASFSKEKEIRFIGHLDLMRTMQRALRRSGLPLRYSNGFSPHILLGFAAPLSVGVVGMKEWMDVPLAEDVPPAEFRDRLNAVLPKAIRIGVCIPGKDKMPALMALVAGAEYRILFSAADFPPEVPALYEAFAAQEEIVTLRKTKSGEKDCNIKKFVQSSHIERQGDNWVLYLTVAAESDGMLKPVLWYKAFASFCHTEDKPHLAYRDEILALSPEGSLVPMEESLL